jgi:hypothetical protein
MRRVRVGGGEAVVTIELQPDLLNNHGAGHGGVVISLSPGQSNRQQSPLTGASSRPARSICS